MSEYTAEDFKDARFARHGHGAKAVRWEMNYRVPWHTAIGDRFSDEQMAENGWAPVVEADGPVVTEGTLRHVEARAERKRQKLIAHIASVEAALRDRNRVIAELRHDLAVARKGREPWSDLADVLRGTVWERLSGDVDGLAAAVHAAGWRKGGEES